jgi:phosphoserine phosphatase
MNNVLTIVSNPDAGILNDGFVQKLAIALGAARFEWLRPDVAVDLFDVQNVEAISELLTDLPLDYCLQNVAHRRKKLLISDMDSTIIQQECIDEIASMAGVGAQVASITERAMAGELDFSQSLIARVGLLKGLHVEVLEEVWQNRIQMQAGASELVRTMNEMGAYTMLVSGGFTFFTAKVAAHLGFQAHFANELLIENNCLTGEVRPPILHKDAKKSLLLQHTEKLGIDISEAIAVGDGANDAAMIEAAGLGVAYNAKPYLRSVANCAINHTDLTSLLYFQGVKP